MPTSPEGWISRILDKLEEARASGRTCFGSEKHGFRLNRVVPEALLQQFERKNRVSLPQDYRSFLRLAGNGGAGPYYGIRPLEEWNDFADWAADGASTDFLSRPCPIVEGRRLDESWESTYPDGSAYFGTMSICDQGCTYAAQLVVAGTLRGRILYVDANGSPPYIVREPCFLSWYERWLDELLQGFQSTWFGYGPGGGPAAWLSILEDSGADESLRSEAAAAFARLPRLAGQEASQLLSYCTDPIAGVRAGTLTSLETHGLPVPQELGGKLLKDPSPEVRKAAVRTLMKTEPGIWGAEVRNLLLHEKDAVVAESAFFRLRELGLISRLDTQRILEASQIGNLRQLAAHARQWIPEDFDLLVRLLRDENPQVRFYATLGLRQVKRAGSLGPLLELLGRESNDDVIGSVLKALQETPNSGSTEALLEWAKSTSDFHRLDAVLALILIGDARVLPQAKSMLSDSRKPVQRDESGLSRQIMAKSFAELVREALGKSPNPKLRDLLRGSR